MFERYTEKARRVIFFARYEASHFASPAIEPEHLLLGLLREDTRLARRFLLDSASVESIRRQIQDTHLPLPQPMSTSVDMPLADSSKRVLAYAAEEAERLAHRHIGTDHILLGLLREKDSLAGNILTGHGLSIDAVRQAVSEQPNESPADVPANPRALRAVAGGVRSQPRPDPVSQLKRARLLRSIRVWLGVVILGLVLSGITAFPLQHETALLVCIAAHLNLSGHAPALNGWIVRVAAALADTDARYPFLAYGTDWLAFAHLVIAVAFLGPWRHPIRNQWVVTWGLIACAGVPLLALIAEPIRGIPLFWSLIDCSFGVFCCLFLVWVRRRIQQLAALSPAS